MITRPAQDHSMIIRKRRRTTFNISLCFSTSICLLLVFVTAFQMYMSVHRVHPYYYYSLSKQQHDVDYRIHNQDDIPKRQPEAPRLRDAAQPEDFLSKSSRSYDESVESSPLTVDSSSNNRRVVHLESNVLNIRTRKRTVEPLSNAGSPPKRDDSVIRPFERPFYRDCSVLNDWQIRPTCNLLHEIESDETSLLSTRGSWRSVWTVNRTVILKRLHFDRDWNHEAYVRHDTDALAMEKLTRSNYICDIYASCGPSVLTEAASDSARIMLKNPNLSGLDRLELAVELATALADVHDQHIMHNDLNMANILYMNGTLKLNDFNIGIRMRQFPHNGTVCRVPVRFDAPLWKSPEEIQNTSYVDGYAADVYGLGNLLFQVLTKRQPWTHLETPRPLNKTEVAVKKLAGGLPNLPEKYTAYSGASTILGQAVLACFRMERRPSARTIANVLASAVRYFRNHPDTYLDLPDNLFDG